ncbi:Hypp2663 [Branchiostoma lanceolatum]|uniref:Hypp2663 protein n=1 Tax=Branchiostoma lanceolatum TaxID=7740 RepID=A0A8J9ZW90_BRALA|nr:Hypp2663 [Branchiostoma lanceolatum]
MLAARGPFLSATFGNAHWRLSSVLQTTMSVRRPPYSFYCSTSTENSRRGKVGDDITSILAISHKPRALVPFKFFNNNKYWRASKRYDHDDGKKNRTKSRDARSQALAKAQLKVVGRDTKAKVRALLLMSIASTMDRQRDAWSREEERMLGALYVLLQATEALLEHHLKIIHDKTTQPTPREQQTVQNLDKELYRLRKLRHILKSYMRTMIRWERGGKCEREREKILQELTLRLEEEADKMEGGKINRWKNFRAFVRSFREMFSIWYSGRS